MDTDTVIAGLAAGQHGVLSRRQALDAGVSSRALEHRLSRGRLERAHAGVYRVSGSPESWNQEIMAACLAAGPWAVASHRAAGALHGLAAVDARLELSVPAPRAPRRGAVLVHRTERLARTDVSSVYGVPCTRPARTVVDLAGVLSAEALAVALDDALSRRLISCAYLRRRLDALGRRGRRGAGVLGDLLDDRTAARPRSQSDFERQVLRLLDAAGLPRPYTQYPVRIPGRGVVFLDIAYPEDMLAIEADSYRHHSSRTGWERDHTRNNLLVAVGWRVLPVTWGDLMDRPQRVVVLVERALRRNPRPVGESAQTSECATMAVA